MAGLAVGGLAIFVALQEKERYKTKLVKLFFYYLVLTNIAMVKNLSYNYFIANLVNDSAAKTICWVLIVYRFAALILLFFVFRVLIDLIRCMREEEFSRFYRRTLAAIWLILALCALFNIDTFIEAINMPFTLLVNLIVNTGGMLLVVFELITGLVMISRRERTVEKTVLMRVHIGFLGLFALIIFMLPLQMFVKFPSGLHPVIGGAGLLLMNLIPFLKLKKYLGLLYSKEECREASLVDEMLGKGEITEKEAEVIKLICEGLTNQEISDRMYLSLQTIKDYNYRIYRKVGVKNRVQLTKKFIASGEN